MAEPLSKAAPPPPTPQQLAQRRKQVRLVLGTLLGLLILAGAWQGISYLSSAPERAEEKVQAGIRNLRPGGYQQAIPLFDEALKMEPNNWNAYFQRGVAHQNLGHLTEALSDLQMAVQLKPDLLEAVTARAGIYMVQGDQKRAIEELTKVIQAKPNMEAYHRRGEAYALLGEHEKAIEDFTWVIQEVRDAPYAYLARAKSKRALGDTAGADLDEQTAFSFDHELQRQP